MDMERVTFEGLFISVFRDKFCLKRTELGYQHPFVNSCFFFWQEGKA